MLSRAFLMSAVSTVRFAIALRRDWLSVQITVSVNWYSVIHSSASHRASISSWKDDVYVPPLFWMVSIHIYI